MQLCDYREACAGSRACSGRRRLDRPGNSAHPGVLDDRQHVLDDRRRALRDRRPGRAELAVASVTCRPVVAAAGRRHGSRQTPARTPGLLADPENQGRGPRGRTVRAALTPKPPQRSGLSHYQHGRPLDPARGLGRLSKCVHVMVELDRDSSRSPRERVPMSRRYWHGRTCSQ